MLESFPTQTKPRPRILRLPLIRGVIGFVDSLTLGYKCLMRSAEISGLEELEAEMERERVEKKAAKKAAKAAKKEGNILDDVSVSETSAIDTQETIETVETVETAETMEVAQSAENSNSETSVEATTEKAEPVKSETSEKKSSPMMNLIMVVSVLIAVVIMVGLFIIFPAWLYEKLSGTGLSIFSLDNRYFRSVFEGVLRVLLLVGYMALMCLMKDIRRTFQYHGAEHKTIFCYEAGLELTVENVRKQRRFHPRCGTSFLILMMLVSILIGFFIPPDLFLPLRVGIKLLLIPVIMGLGYELIKLCGRHDNWLTRIISQPGVWLQHITVFEPDDSMIECAIAAMKEVIPSDESDSW